MLNQRRPTKGNRSRINERKIPLFETVEGG